MGKKSKYIVRSGNVNTIVKAINNQMACILAINKTKDWNLALFMGSKKINESDDEERFIKTEYILQCMGMNKSEQE